MGEGMKGTTVEKRGDIIMCENFHKTFNYLKFDQQASETIVFENER